MAILEVDGPVEADGVNVAFASLAETDAEDFVGSSCEIADWGGINNSRTHLSVYLFYHITILKKYLQFDFCHDFLTSYRWRIS